MEDFATTEGVTLRLAELNRWPCSLHCPAAQGGSEVGDYRYQAGDTWHTLTAADSNGKHYISTHLSHSRVP